MKTFELILLLSVTFGVSSLPAQNTGAASGGPDIQKAAYDTSLAQAAVQKDTAQIQTQLHKLIEDLTENGMNDELIAFLEESSLDLDHLSQQDMARVISALQQAGASSDAAVQQANLQLASQGQEQLSMKLNSLTRDLASHQIPSDLASLLRRLIVRQSANLRLTKTFAALQNPGSLKVEHQRVHQVVSTEQVAIGQEIEILLKLVPNSVAAITAAGDASTANQLAASAAELKNQSDSALTITQSGPFLDAVQLQDSIRVHLQGILATIIGKEDALTRLKEAKQQVDRTLAEEKEMQRVTERANGARPRLEEREARIADQTANLQPLVGPLNPSAAQQLSAAQQAMQKSSADLAANPPQAQADQTEAIARLTDAQQSLQQQMAAMERQQQETVPQQIADLQKLQQQVDQAQKAAEANPTRELGQTVAQLAQQATVVAPQVSETLTQAADQLQTSEPAAATPPAADPTASAPTPAAAAPSAISPAGEMAAQMLTQASAELQKQQNQMAAAAQAQEKMKVAAQQLQQAEQQASQANQAAEKATSGDQAKVAGEFAATQDKIKQIEASALPASAQHAIQQAAQAMQEAQNHLAQGDKDAAQAMGRQGQQSLQMAQTLLSEANPHSGFPKPGGLPWAPTHPMTPGTQPNNQNPQGKGGELAGSANSKEVLQGFGSTDGAGQVNGSLSSKDREAIAEYESEKTPEDYTPLVQQYLKNLSSTTPSPK